jgi:hypothetical protein
MKQVKYFKAHGPKHNPNDFKDEASGNGRSQMKMLFPNEAERLDSQLPPTPVCFPITKP